MTLWNTTCPGSIPSAPRARQVPSGILSLLRRQAETGAQAVNDRKSKKSDHYSAVASPSRVGPVLVRLEQDVVGLYAHLYLCVVETLCFHGCLVRVWMISCTVFLTPFMSLFDILLTTLQQPDLKAGDIVKMDLGCHLDGYIAVAAHTVVVKESPDAAGPPEDTEMGNVAVAAYNAMLVAAASISAGAKNSEVTAAVQRVASAYGVTPISSVRMHQMKRYVLDGVKEVALKAPDPEEPEEEKVPECTFEQAEVYAVDVAMSTGDGRARPGELRTTVFKRNVEKQYLLKVKASRQVLAEVDKRFPTLPFTMRHLTDVRTARLGINECIAHGLLTPYPSLHEYSGKVAHFKCTVLLLPSGTTRVTGLPLPQYFSTDKEADEETQKILQEIADKEAKKAAQKLKKKNKKKK
jgi:curved DNA binding protein